MNLYLIRHGQTEFSRENRFCGTSDPALTAAGQAMAQAFADAYAATPWQAIYTSPLACTRQTAPVAAVSMFVLEKGSARLTVLGDRAHLTEDLRNQEGT